MNRIANTPKPPYYDVIFTSFLHNECTDYAAVARTAEALPCSAFDSHWAYIFAATPAEARAKAFWHVSELSSRSNGRYYDRLTGCYWHGYKPVPSVSSIDEFVTAVDADPYCCFFG